MGIDGIGKPPGVPPPTGPTGPSGSGAGFRVEQAGAVAPTKSAELDRLGRGEITLDEYLNARVGEATDHLKSKLSTEELAFVQSTLRAQLETDPVLIELVRRATGQTIGS